MMLCKACNRRINSRGTFGHFSKTHPELVEQYKEHFGDGWWEKAKNDYFVNHHGGEVEEHSEDMIEFDGEHWTPERLVYQYGESGLFMLMQKELEKRMVESKLQNRQMVLEAFGEFRRYQEDSLSLKGLLKSLGKAQDPIADLICERVFAVPKKYQRVFQRATQQQPTPAPQPTQQPPPPQQPPPEPAERPLTKSELLQILDERERERERKEYLKKLEDENRELKKRLGKLEKSKTKLK